MTVIAPLLCAILAETAPAAAAPPRTPEPARRPASAAASAVSPPKTATRSEISGAYLPVDGSPAAFAEIAWIEIRQAEGQDPAVKGALSGRLGLHTADEPEDIGGFVDLTGLKLDGLKLSFSTTELDGVSYRFSGRLLKLGDFAVILADHGELILEGRLTKLLRGRQVAAANLRFTYWVGD
ncbi:MAG TPA: hypothetical protein VHR45_11405 [Thermoanaerobaculia bacterium]|nr:hypothetical protein [Thermoanaerobaculia bacterium]